MKTSCSQFTIHCLLFTTYCLLFFLLFFVKITFAGVIGYDDVTTANKAVRLKALTKGKLFPEGGRIAEFYIDGKRIGTALSGGDGYAFLEYLPASRGIKHLKVRAGIDTDEGVLLVIGENNKVLMIEIEGILLESIFTPQPVKGSKETIQRLSKRFRIIYLTTAIGLKKSREWLRKNGFPKSTVLKWEGTPLLDDLQEKGIKPNAIIGSPAVVSRSSEHIKKRFSFEDTEDGIVVKDWKELLKKLW